MRTKERLVNHDPDTREASDLQALLIVIFSIK